MTLSATVGRRLRDLRVSAGLSVRLLAKRSGLTPAELRRIEGGGKASVGHLGQVAAQLGTTLAEVIWEARRQAAPPPTDLSGAEAIARAIVDLPDGGDKLDLIEAPAVRHALERAGGNQTEAARLLGLDRQRLRRRLDRFRD